MNIYVIFRDELHFPYNYYSVDIKQNNLKWNEADLGEFSQAIPTVYSGVNFL